MSERLCKKYESGKCPNKCNWGYCEVFELNNFYKKLERMGVIRGRR